MDHEEATVVEDFVGRRAGAREDRPGDLAGGDVLAQPPRRPVSAEELALRGRHQEEVQVRDPDVLQQVDAQAVRRQLARAERQRQPLAVERTPLIMPAPKYRRLLERQLEEAHDRRCRRRVDRPHTRLQRQVETHQNPGPARRPDRVVEALANVERPGAERASPDQLSAAQLAVASVEAYARGRRRSGVLTCEVPRSNPTASISLRAGS
jgi:hypothetical protein